MLFDVVSIEVSSFPPKHTEIFSYQHESIVVKIYHLVRVMTLGIRDNCLLQSR